MTTYMKTLLSCLRTVEAQGYTDNFKVLNQTLTSLKTGHSYMPEDVRILNFFRFEGASNPDDNAILYIIETNDGSMGTLVDGYGISADTDVGNFMLNVQDFHKKIERKNA